MSGGGGELRTELLPQSSGLVLGQFLGQGYPLPWIELMAWRTEIVWASITRAERQCCGERLSRQERGTEGDRHCQELRHHSVGRSTWEFVMMCVISPREEEGDCKAVHSTTSVNWIPSELDLCD